MDTYNIKPENAWGEELLIYSTRPMKEATAGFEGRMLPKLEGSYITPKLAFKKYREKSNIQQDVLRVVKKWVIHSRQFGNPYKKTFLETIGLMSHTELKVKNDLIATMKKTDAMKDVNISYEPTHFHILFKQAEKAGIVTNKQHYSKRRRLIN